MSYMRTFCTFCNRHVDLLVNKGNIRPKCSICKSPIPIANQIWGPRYAGDDGRSK